MLIGAAVILAAGWFIMVREDQSLTQPRWLGKPGREDASLPNQMPEETDALGVPGVGRIEIARPGDQMLADDVLVQLDA